MEQLLKFIIFLCLVFWHAVFASPIPGHQSGPEHIILVDHTHPTPPQVAEVLQRLDLHENHPDVKHIYNNSAFRGFAAAMNSHCLDLLAQMSDVSVVEETTTIAKTTILVPASGVFDTRGSAPWGLQRISSDASMRGNPSNLDFTYSFGNAKLGAGVDVYIIDTGVYTQHNAFNGRAQVYWSFDGSHTDDDGHGTHVSGIAAGNILGVASNANIFGMKVIGKNGGTTSTVIKGIDETIKCHDSRKGRGDVAGAVLSMSLASPGRVGALNSAIEGATRAGVHAVVAAGNNGFDACKISPSSSGGKNGPAITVGAIDIDAERADFSNYGDCVDVYAPGVGIISAWNSGPNDVKSLAGTSMATPHVTGLVAYAMANTTLAENPALMKRYISASAVRSRGGLLLANNGVNLLFAGGAAEPSEVGADADADADAKPMEDGDCPDEN